MRPGLSFVVLCMLAASAQAQEDRAFVSIPVLSMHAPYELLSKADLHEGFRAYRAFLED